MKRYLEFITELNRDTEYEQNRILDKISDNGIESLTPKEKAFLDSIKDGNESEVLKKQEKTTWDNGTFKFEAGSSLIQKGDEYKIYGSLWVDHMKFTGEINLDEGGRVNYYMFEPDLSDEEIHIFGDPDKGDDVRITMGGNEVVSWNSEELLEDEDAFDAATEMFRLYRSPNENDHNILRDRLLSVMNMKNKDVTTFFDDILEEEDIEMDFYEFIDSIVDDIL